MVGLRGCRDVLHLWVQFLFQCHEVFGENCPKLSKIIPDPPLLTTLIFCGGRVHMVNGKISALKEIFASFSEKNPVFRCNNSK